MKSLIQQIKRELQQKWNNSKNNFINYLKKHQNRILAISAVLLLFYFKDISFSVQMNSSTAAPSSVAANYLNPDDRSNSIWAVLLKILKAVSPLEVEETSQIVDYGKKTPKKIADEDEQFGIFNIEDLIEKKRTPEAQVIFERQADYIKKYAALAQAEMQAYAIPASITLAQGIVETNGGISRLATGNNNHFGIKCFSQKCKKGHCSNFTDDTHKDFFRKYDSVKESYRSHSNLLTSNRYKKLFQLEITDYRGWAHGLKKAGYATDKHYAEKLIEIIEEHELHRYDNETI